MSSKIQKFTRSSRSQTGDATQEFMLKVIGIRMGAHARERCILTTSVVGVFKLSSQQLQLSTHAAIFSWIRQTWKGNRNQGLRTAGVMHNASNFPMITNRRIVNLWAQETKENRFTPYCDLCLMCLITFSPVLNCVQKQKEVKTSLPHQRCLKGCISASSLSIEVCKIHKCWHWFPGLSGLRFLPQISLSFGLSLTYEEKKCLFFW